MDEIGERRYLSMGLVCGECDQIAEPLIPVNEQGYVIVEREREVLASGDYARLICRKCAPCVCIMDEHNNVLYDGLATVEAQMIWEKQPLASMRQWY